jgi:hypothetical protein
MNFERITVNMNFNIDNTETELDFFSKYMESRNQKYF